MNRLLHPPLGKIGNFCSREALRRKSDGREGDVKVSRSLSLCPVPAPRPGYFRLIPTLGFSPVQPELGVREDFPAGGVALSSGLTQ